MEMQEKDNALWSPTPVCCCTNLGKPTMIDGEAYVFRNPSCRIHKAASQAVIEAVSAERVIGDWNGREKEK